MGLFKAKDEIPLPNKDILSWIFDEPKYDEDEPIYIDAENPSRSISLRQARVIIRKLVAGFHAAGVEPGDCVCLHSFNDVKLRLAFHFRTRSLQAGTNPAYTQYELVHHIKTARAKFMITEPEMLDSVLKAADNCGIPRSCIWIFDVLGQKVPTGFKSFNELMEKGEKSWVRFNDERTSKTTTAARLSSSGTTGLPKTVSLSHYNFIAEHHLVFEFGQPLPHKVKRLLALPMFHAAGVPVAHTTALRLGHTSVIMRRFEMESYLAGIETFQITDIALVPPMIVAIIMSGLAKKYSLDSVKCAMSGAAPLGRDTQARFKKLLPPDARVFQVWGMTELSCVATFFHYPEDDVTGSVGRCMPNCEIKLIDDFGKDISAYDVRGEIAFRGPTVASLGYFENQKANAESYDSDGFFRTGDIGFCDSKSHKWYIVDRKKELIKVRGFQVAPPELETVLLSHPLIIDAAVIGVKHPSEADVELPRAYVVRKAVSDGRTLDEATVKRYCGARLANFKQLTGGVRFVESIPKNASGKILKKLLRDEASKEFKACRARI